MEEKIYDFWFYSIVGLKEEQREQLIAKYQSTKEIYRAPIEDLKETVAIEPWLQKHIYK